MGIVDIDSCVQELEREFFRHADPAVSMGQMAYMKNNFNFLGLKKPIRSKIQKMVFRNFDVDTEKSLVRIITILWDKEAREYQYAALDLAWQYRKLWSPEMLQVFEMMVRKKSWWDTVDMLASRCLGELILYFPDLKAEMGRWIVDDDMWIRRSALLFQLRYKKNVDLGVLFGYCELALRDKDFFIRKAIGWALREHSKLYPNEVKAFINRNRSTLSSLSMPFLKP